MAVKSIHLTLINWHNKEYASTIFIMRVVVVPPRASLLTGLYQHQAGIGRMTFDDNLPGYRGTLSRNAVTIAEVLKESGYTTSMIGKWHVAETPLRKDQREWLAHHVYHDTYSDLCHYPVNRGFDSHYGTIYGVVDYFDPIQSLVEGGSTCKRSTGRILYHSSTFGIVRRRSNGICQG